MTEQSVQEDRALTSKNVTDIEPVQTISEQETRAKESPLGGAFAGITRALTRAVASFGKAGISGTLAGMSEEIAGYPLDIVKTRMQVHPESAMQGTFTVLKNIIKHEGFTGLFSGLASPLAGSALLNAVLFGAYERSLSQFQKYFIRTEEGYPISAIPLHYYFYAGAIGGLVSTFVTCPVDAVKNKMQVMGLDHGHSATPSGAEGAKMKSLTTFDVFKLTLRTGGIRGIYLGIAPTLYRDIPGYGIYFFVYEGLKRKLGITGSEHEAHGGGTHGGANIVTVIFAGGTAGIIYHAATYPIDVVKSVVQIQKTDEKGRPIEFKGTADCFKQIYKLYGWKGFINGIGPTVIKSFPASGVGFAVYEISLKLLQ